MSNNIKASEFSNYLSCLYTNPTSLNNKLPELEAVLTDTRFPHLVFIAQTFFSELSITKISNYSILIQHRIGVAGGSAFVFVMASKF